MIGSERALWRLTRKKVAPYPGRLIRIETPIAHGVPDVYYIILGNSGWLELKYEPAWPTRGDRLRFGTLTIDQVLWLEAERAALGSAWILAQIGTRYLVPLPLLWHDLIGNGRGADPDEVLDTALVRDENGEFPTRQLINCLTRPNTTVKRSQQ